MVKDRSTRVWLTVTLVMTIRLAGGCEASPYDLAYDATNTTPPQSPKWSGWLNYWNESTPGEQAVSVSASSQNGPAWQLTNVTGNQVFPLYSTQSLDSAGSDLARSEGWALSTRAQLESSPLGQIGAHGLMAVFEETTYAVYIGRNASGSLEATLNRPSLPYPTVDLQPSTLSGAYYDYQLRYDPASTKVSFYFADQYVGVVDGAPTIPSDHPDVFRFGTLNDAAASTMNYRQARFTILDTAASPIEQGDYNGDGRVTLGDYNVWRDLLGSTTNLAADGNGNRRVDSGDYHVWKSHFGSTLASVSISGDARLIAEPCGILLALPGVAFLVALTMTRLSFKHKKGRHATHTDPLATSTRIFASEANHLPYRV